MNFNEYLPLALRTAKVLPTPRDDLRHACLGFITEIGEFVSEVKRHVIYEKPISDEMRQHMLEELGDAMWYVPTLLKAVDSSILPGLEDDQGAEIRKECKTLADAALMLHMLSAIPSATYIQPEGFERDEVRKMAAALVWTIEIAAELLGSSGDAIRAENIAKLQKRFPNAFSNEAAEARADKDGASHLVS